MKKLLLIGLFFISSFSYSQGVHFAFGSGTSIFRLEGGYSISDNLHVGGYFSPGFSLLDLPSSYGGYGRYNFDDNDFGGGFIDASFRGYIGADLGLISLQGSTEYDFWTGETVVTPSQSTLGVSAFGGVEFLYGRKGKFGSFIEGHIGRNANYFNTLSTILGGETKLTSIWGLNAGLRFYFGN